MILNIEMESPSVILCQFSQLLKKYLYPECKVLKIIVLRIRCYGDWKNIAGDAEDCG